MCALTNHIDDRAERYLNTLFGVLRVRHLATSTLNSLMQDWSGEYALREIPVAVIQSELAFRGIRAEQ